MPATTRAAALTGRSRTDDAPRSRVTVAGSAARCWPSCPAGAACARPSGPSFQRGRSTCRAGRGSSSLPRARRRRASRRLRELAGAAGGGAVVRRVDRLRRAGLAVLRVRRGRAGHRRGLVDHLGAGARPDGPGRRTTRRVVAAGRHRVPAPGGRRWRGRDDLGRIDRELLGAGIHPGHPSLYEPQPPSPRGRPDDRAAPHEPDRVCRSRSGCRWPWWPRSAVDLVTLR